MIEKQILQKYATKTQTSFRNVLREYLQHLFLTHFYQNKASENFLFKGGTALKLVFGSPRFSEDLDFSGSKNSKIYEKILEKVLIAFSLENIKVDLLESKPTSGGHLSILEFNLLGEVLQIGNEISLRPKKPLVRETVVIAPEIVPSYTVYTLVREAIIDEKIKALMARQKPRDLFDLYFILRKESLRPLVKLKPNQAKKIFSILEDLDKKEVARELKRLLPRSFWPISKELPRVLKKELVGLGF